MRERRCRRIRPRERGETQGALAERAGIAIPTLPHIEAGHANPTWATARDIAAAMDISIAELAKLFEKHE